MQGPGPGRAPGRQQPLKMRRRPTTSTMRAVGVGARFRQLCTAHPAAALARPASALARPAAPYMVGNARRIKVPSWQRTSNRALSTETATDADAVAAAEKPAETPAEDSDESAEDSDESAGGVVHCPGVLRTQVYLDPGNFGPGPGSEKVTAPTQPPPRPRTP